MSLSRMLFNSAIVHLYISLIRLIPEDIISAPTLSSFRRRLKPFLFQQSYPDIII